MNTINLPDGNIHALRAMVVELKAENEKLAKALAAVPTDLEERKVEALELIGHLLEKAYHYGFGPGDT